MTARPQTGKSLNNLKKNLRQQATIIMPSSSDLHRAHTSSGVHSDRALLRLSSGDKLNSPGLSDYQTTAVSDKFLNYIQNIGIPIQSKSYDFCRNSSARHYVIEKEMNIQSSISNSDLHN